MALPQASQTLSLVSCAGPGVLAADQHHQFPAALRHLLRGIGAAGAAGWDLVSYLAFQPEYVSKLIELGHEDTLARRAEVEAFFEAKVTAGV